jgi:4a-hydroxytetrahydrobiopterin dehydratase
MATELATRHCKPCEGGVAPLRPEQVEELMPALHDGWVLSDDGTAIARRFEFPAYSRTLGFTNAVAWIAITEGHHPDMTFSYGYCIVSYTTHAIGGLSDNDFICAAKVDRLAKDTVDA